jgi:hypothetical protein
VVENDITPPFTGAGRAAAGKAAAATAAAAATILFVLHGHSPEVILLRPLRRLTGVEAEGHAHAAVVDRGDLAGQLPNTSFTWVTRISRLGPMF